MAHFTKPTKKDLLSDLLYSHHQNIFIHVFYDICEVLGTGISGRASKDALIHLFESLKYNIEEEQNLSV